MPKIEIMTLFKRKEETGKDEPSVLIRFPHFFLFGHNAPSL